MARPFEHIKPTLLTWGQGPPRVLILPGAGQDPGCWRPLALALAGQGVVTACLEYPGHGPEPWPLPPSTCLKDYELLAARAAAELGRPILVGHDMGGWLAQKLLGLADMPALLLAPWPERLALAASAPHLGWRLLRGLPIAPGLLQEPLGVRWQSALGMAKPAGRRNGNAPCLLAAPGKNPLIPVKGLVCMARAMQAEIVHMPQSGHHLWQDHGPVLELVKKLAARI